MQVIRRRQITGYRYQYNDLWTQQNTSGESFISYKKLTQFPK